MMDTFECCEWGDERVETDEGEEIFGELCDCTCHDPDNWEY